MVEDYGRATTLGELQSKWRVLWKAGGNAYISNKLLCQQGKQG